MNLIKNEGLRNDLEKLIGTDSPFTNAELAKYLETSESSVKRLKAGKVYDISLLNAFANIHGKKIIIN